jgi:hypothetical protein
MLRMLPYTKTHRTSHAAFLFPALPAASLSPLSAVESRMLLLLHIQATRTPRRCLVDSILCPLSKSSCVGPPSSSDPQRWNSARLWPLNASVVILVISWISCFNDILLPNYLPFLEKNSRHGGARSSCNVQPRINHRLPRKGSVHVIRKPQRRRPTTSDRYT